MKYLLVVALFACLCPCLQGQKLIAVHHLGDASFFTTLTDAYNAALSGDTIYIPGGNFYESITMDKTLALIGVGHHPDSTLATERTFVNSLHISENADNSFITGIFTGLISSSGEVTDVSISRCYLGGLDLDGQTTNWIISENWIDQPIWANAISAANASFFVLSNNVVKGGIESLNLSVISHNIFLGGQLYATQSQIKNNVFQPSSDIATTNSDWLNNLNRGVNGVAGSNTGSGNYLDNVPLETVFVNYNYNNYYWQNDFHVVNPAYVGENGTPVGIYGGTYPWKAGSVPFNPHIQVRAIAPAVNEQGNLNVQVRVAAQDH